MLKRPRHFLNQEAGKVALYGNVLKKMPVKIAHPEPRKKKRRIYWTKLVV